MVATNDDIVKELKNITALLAGLYSKKEDAIQKINTSENVLTELSKV